MNLGDLTPVVLTANEEDNLARTLAQLRWADEVIVVDSLSSDATPSIAQSFPNVRFVQRPIDTLAGQSNFGLAAARTEWALLLDADYFMPPAFVDELQRLEPSPAIDAYRGAFVYAVGGRPLRASLYPPRIVLLRRARARVIQDGHAHRVVADGAIADLHEKLVHDDRKSFRRFVERQRRYMKQEAAKLRSTPFSTLNVAGKIRRLIFVAPFAVVLHSLFVRGLFLDGTAGLRYVMERFVAECILSRELLRARS